MSILNLPKASNSTAGAASLWLLATALSGTGSAGVARVPDIPQANATTVRLSESPRDSAVASQPSSPGSTWYWSLPVDRSWIEVEGDGGNRQKLESGRRSQSWAVGAASGQYEERIAAVGAEVAEPMRHFNFSPNEPLILLPPDGEQFRRASARARPRFLVAQAANHAEADGFVKKVMKEGVSTIIDRSFEMDMNGTDEMSRLRAKRDAKLFGQSAAERLTATALALQLGAPRGLGAEAKRRLLEAASWDPLGYSGNDKGDNLAARDILVGMALLYDTLHGDLLVDERKLIRDRIIERAEAIKREFVDGGRMQRQPLNSHGWTAWGGAAAAAVLVAGEDPRADKLFRDLVPGFVNSISPWGGAAGGYGNGPVYAVWDLAALMLPFDVIGQTIGIDLYKKPWLANVGRFLTYFLPPGAPEGSLGDGAEFPPERVGFWTMRALAQRTHDPLVAWAAGQAGPQVGGPMSLVLASLGEPLPKVGLPAGTSNSAVFTDIGWAAMHSDLGDPARTSIYFKSSPYGSYSHSHADQNAFVVHAGGRALLKNSGYYDSYFSEHALNWYITTQAHNAITFDGGEGQATRSRTARGEIITNRLEDDYSVVVGDATAAYTGQLTEATRAIVFLRPNLIIIHDRLASDIPRTWEWNFHADSRVKGDERSARVESGSQSLCIDMLQGPASHLEQRSGFAVPPRSKGKPADFREQWHAAYIAKERSLRSEYVFAMRVGCSGEVPRLVHEAGGWAIAAVTDRGRRLVTLGAKGVDVK